GEVWEDASNKISYGKRRTYFLGSQLDTVMNYPLKNAIIDYIVHRKDGAALEQLANSLWENYPKPAYTTLMNILGTHDTVRILTVLSENSKDDDYTRQRLFLAMLITAFMPGIPCVYYGDEIGMKGGRDPMNRMCFDLVHGDLYILRFFKRLFQFRKKIHDLGEYSFQPRTSEGSFYSFTRNGVNSRLVIAGNAGNQDYLLNLAMKENENLIDFFISGSVSFERQGVFRIKENSGIVALINCTEFSTM
ncbi:MAG: alpha-amylase family glycosyl hydrolase, partial [Bacillota bacterium]